MRNNRNERMFTPDLNRKEGLQEMRIRESNNPMILMINGRWLAIAALLIGLLGFAPVVSADQQSVRDIPADRISQAIDDALYTARGVAPRDITIATVNGVVTLDGEVDSVLAKRRATRIAERTKGVRAVVNRLDVRRSDRSDAQVRADVIVALASDPATESWEIGVKVDDGHVTLDGNVDSWQERWLAERVALGVRGVRELENELNVSYDTDRPDGEILNEIRQRLMWDSRVNDALIAVFVNDGEVSLRGAVGSAYEKQMARRLAWSVGVSDVSVDELEVKHWLGDDMRRYDRFADLKDEQIEEAVVDAMMFDPRVLSFKPEVEVDAGVATLRGVVSSLKAKRAAAQDAANTVGVWHVINRLKVRPAANLTDTAVWSDVADAFERDPMLDRYELYIKVDDGVVTLTGEVDSLYDVWQAEELASRVTGVTDVNNNIEVEYTEPDYQLYTVYDWDPLLFDLDFTRYEPLPDSAIRKEIEEELFWSPFVDSDDVSVSVDDGVATLKGKVDSWYEHHAATENAYEGGAFVVKNQLDLTFGPDLRDEAGQ